MSFHWVEQTKLKLYLVSGNYKLEEAYFWNIDRGVDGKGIPNGEQCKQVLSGFWEKQIILDKVSRSVLVGILPQYVVTDCIQL